MDNIPIGFSAGSEIIDQRGSLKVFIVWAGMSRLRCKWVVSNWKNGSD